MVLLPRLFVALGLARHIIASALQDITSNRSLALRAMTGPICELRYGWPTFQKCRDALAQLPIDPTTSPNPMLTFGPAGSPNLDVALPQVFSSGECAIAVLNWPDTQAVDHTNWGNIKLAALSVLEECTHQRRVGGYSLNIGRNENLGVFVFSVGALPSMSDISPAESRVRYLHTCALEIIESIQENRSPTMACPIPRPLNCLLDGTAELVPKSGYCKADNNCCEGFKCVAQKVVNKLVLWGTSAALDAKSCI